jgi:hypothetical protein
MMYQNSSTFSFKGGRYLVCLAVALIATLGAAFGFSYYGAAHGLVDHPYQVNYRFQLDKIERSRPIETLFVGDSSLGAMLDTEVWAQLSNRSALHLALTGSDGYAGSLNMARRSLDRLRPRNLVIVHTLDMMTRDVAYVGFLQTNPEPRDEVGIPLYSRVIERFQLYTSRELVVGTVRGLMGKALGTPPTQMGKEYILLPAISGAPTETGLSKPPILSEREINPRKITFLRQLGTLCRARTLNCIYAHGPLYDEVCRASQAYLHAVQRHILSTGIDLVEGTPVCVPRSELGDAIDHVKQDLKAHYTKRYYELIAPYLDADMSQGPPSAGVEGRTARAVGNAIASPARVRGDR